MPRRAPTIILRKNVVMRLPILLLEARQEYTDMVFNIPIHLQDGRTITAYEADFDPSADTEAQSPLRYYVDHIREVMIRRDRIVWAMRYLKLLVAKEIRTMVADELSVWDDEDASEEDAEHQGFFSAKFGSLPAVEQPEVDEIIKRLSWLDMEWMTDQEDCYGAMDDLLNKVSHFIQVGEAIAHNEDHPRPNNRLRSYIFDRQPVEQVVTELRDIEAETKEENRSGVKTTTGTPIITFPDKWAWFDLENWCDDSEAASMGHCGNRGGKQGSETVLSLREPLKHGWMPHATFILDKRYGSLGEMKGYGNNKPSPKYHPYIVALLKNKIVKHVIGGGYRAEGNFCLYKTEGMSSARNGWTDLSAEMAEDLHAARPEIWWVGNHCQYCLNTAAESDCASDQSMPQ
jgi:hypothetical protein